MQASRYRLLTIFTAIAGTLLVLALTAPARAQDDDFGTSVTSDFVPPPAVGGRAAAPAGAYGRVPTPQELSGATGSGWGQNVAPGLSRAAKTQGVYGNVSYANVAELDPNVTLPEQSIRDFAESAGPEQPPIECSLLPWGPWKSVRAQATWIGGDDLGFIDLEVWTKIAFPTISEHSVLTLTPGYGLHVVDGPPFVDLPPKLHDLYLDVQWITPFSREWAIELGVTPGLYGDFASSAEDPFRLGARVVGYYTLAPVWRFAAGVAYLDRDDVQFFPLGGVIWTPSENIRAELVLPRPKYSQRVNVCGGCEDWWFVGGEFGGGSWAVERADGTADKANYSDWRLSVGWERRTKAGATGLVEAGYVFRRNLSFDSGGPDFEPGSTFMLRGMLGF